MDDNIFKLKKGILKRVVRNIATIFNQVQKVLITPDEQKILNTFLKEQYTALLLAALMAQFVKNILV